MNCCQRHLNTCFRKRLMFIVTIQDMQLTETMLYKKFQQRLVKEQLIVEELPFGQM